MEKPFAFCALRYLLLWEQKERDIHARMRHHPSPDALREGLYHFRVSRGFRGLKDDKNANLILSALQQVGSDLSLSPEEKVGSLASQFLKDFGQFNLSAATKLLWLTYRRPYLIYDAQTIAALKKTSPKFAAGSYPEYASAWRFAYKQRRAEIIAAVELMPPLQPFFATWHDSPASIEKLVLKPWFLERIFDIYLWELGASEKVPKEA